MALACAAHYWLAMSHIDLEMRNQQTEGREHQCQTRCMPNPQGLLVDTWRRTAEVMSGAPLTETGTSSRQAPQAHGNEIPPCS